MLMIQITYVGIIWNYVIINLMLNVYSLKAN